MAKNNPKGGSREGEIIHRSQSFNPTTKLWTKRDAETGRFLDVKTSGGKFKDVRKERK